MVSVVRFGDMTTVLVHGCGVSVVWFWERLEMSIARFGDRL